MNTVTELREMVVNNLSVKEFEGIVKDLGFKLDNIAGVRRPYPCRVQDAIGALKNLREPIEDAIKKAVAAKAKA